MEWQQGAPGAGGPYGAPVGAYAPTVRRAPGRASVAAAAGCAIPAQRSLSACLCLRYAARASRSAAWQPPRPAAMHAAAASHALCRVAAAQALAGCELSMP